MCSFVPKGYDADVRCIQATVLAEAYETIARARSIGISMRGADESCRGMVFTAVYVYRWIQIVF